MPTSERSTSTASAVTTRTFARFSIACVEALSGAALRRAALTGAPDAVASRIGVSADAIREIGRALAHSHRPVALPPGVGLTSRAAVATNAAVLILNAAVGAVGETEVDHGHIISAGRFMQGGPGRLAKRLIPIRRVLQIALTTGFRQPIEIDSY